MRDNKWLEEKMYFLWENFFVDTPRKNLVLIKFGTKSKRQLGCIKWVSHKTKGVSSLLSSGKPKEEDERTSLILITSYFKSDAIPEEVVLATLAHEMCHYAHGFNSPLQQIYDHPHKGGIIRREMEKRGLGKLYRESNRWLKHNWANYLRRNPNY
jgi:hypothetical protein